MSQTRDILEFTLGTFIISCMPPPTKENTFLKRYLQAANISEPVKTTTSTTTPATAVNNSDSKSVNTLNSNDQDNLNLSDSEIDEIMAAEILPLLQTILSRLEKIEVKIASGGESEQGQLSSSGPSSTDELPKSIRGFDSYVASFVDPFVAAVSSGNV